MASHVCADGGNPDPSSMHSKKATEAKELELKGWPYPKHLKGRHFGVVSHGDSVGAETVRRSLADGLTDLELISAGGMAETDGYRLHEAPTPHPIRNSMPIKRFKKRCSMSPAR
jgi:hypothetical protein